jgi:hypothetical protein
MTGCASGRFAWTLVRRAKSTATCSTISLVQVSSDRIAVAPEPESEGPFREYLEADVIPGAVVEVRRGGIETARNVGKEPYVEVVIELKDLNPDR